jgi:diguanylate cyclase (GGDEF)-like protein/PAS domain S-box-containing protein
MSDAIGLSRLWSWLTERRFRRIAMSLGDGLVGADCDFAITLWNPGAEALFGYRADEILGRPFATICARAGEGSTVTAFALADMPRDRLMAPGGHVAEFEGRRKNGEIFPVEACFSSSTGIDGFQYGAILRDISARHRAVERIRYLAEFDALTGLPNRNSLKAHLDAVFADVSQPRAIMLLAISIDRFQDINDLLGHECGDQVLRAVGLRLSGRIGNRGFVARLNGNEFGLYIDGASEQDAIAMCEDCGLAFASPLLAGAREYRISLSIGVAMFPGDARSFDELLGNAHLALHRAKAGEGTGYMLYQRAFRDELEARLSVEAELVRAETQGEFELFYQPQVMLRDRRTIGAEALIRWHHPQRGLISPGHFMPVVNTSPLSNRIAAWVMDTACRQARAWELMGNPIRVSVNLSPSQFQSGNLAESVRLILAATGLTPSLLELEVTEDILLDGVDRLLAIFAEIQSLGVRIVFDDFGTGYAGLSYLKKFPLDGLKIDQSFVSDLRTNRNAAAIVSSTIDLGRKLGLSLVAEGIEDAATADLLSDMGCEHAQGYFFGRPMPAAEFEAMLLGQRAEALPD